jgi:UDP-galactopyranose mutase
MMRKLASCTRNIKRWLTWKKKIIFGGRLGEYKYYDKDSVIASALECANKQLGDTF